METLRFSIGRCVIRNYSWEPNKNHKNTLRLYLINIILDFDINNLESNQIDNYLRGIYPVQAPTSRFPGSNGMPNVGTICKTTSRRKPPMLAGLSQRSVDWSANGALDSPLKGRKLGLSNASLTTWAVLGALKYPVIQQKSNSTRYTGAREELDLVRALQDYRWVQTLLKVPCKTVKLTMGCYCNRRIY